MRALIRRVVPLYVRKKMCIWKMKARDYARGVEFASLDRQESSFFPIVVHKQTIMPSKNYDQKIHNFMLAVTEIQKFVLKPNQVFSFHRVVGEACQQRGYQKSRSLRNGVLTPTYGGGLCQISGLIYQVSLQLGLDILERHNHSVDIYTEETRYTPLGSDATIVYPFKDVRIRNNSSFSLRFRFCISDNNISLTVESTGFLPVHNIVFQVVETEPQKRVYTRNHHQEIVAISVYEHV